MRAVWLGESYSVAQLVLCWRDHDEAAPLLLCATASLGSLGPSSAAILMVIAMLPMFVLGLYERNGQPLEKALGNIIQTMFLRPKQRPYQTDNLYAALMRQDEMEREVRSIVRKGKTKAHA